MNPLLLLIIIGLIVFVILLWIFRKRKIILFIIVIAAAAVGWYGYKEYYRTNKDLAYVKPDIKIPAADLIKEFEKNDTLADTKYSDKIIETNGIIKVIEKDDKGYTIVLSDTGNMTSVHCTMDTLHQDDAAQLTVGSSSTLRGKYIGFQKNDEMLGINLGSDINLNRCVVIQQKK